MPIVAAPLEKQRDAPQETGMQAQAQAAPTFIRLALSIYPDKLTRDQDRDQENE